MQFIRKSSLFLLLFFSPFFILGQSLSGEMLSSSTNKKLAFGTVSIFQKEKKIATILTDAEGKFSIKLDTGYYRVVFQYVGHHKIVKKVHITGDKKGDFRLEKLKDFKSPAFSVKSDHGKSAPLAPKKGIPGTHRLSSVSMERLSSSADAVVVKRKSYLIAPSGANNEAASGLLTAGEVNDFTKWNRWTDIVTEKLKAYQKTWDLFLQQRFTIQLKNREGSPIVDAKVELLNGNNTVQFIAHTDNTGKAELWGKLGLKDHSIADATAKIYYKNKTYTLSHLTTFKKGINELTINEKCGYSSVVDIAFVVDATGSMGDEINYLKKDLENVIYQSKNDFPKLTFRYANVFYRDHGSDYLTKRQPFTTVLSSSIAFIRQQSAKGGGDRPEIPEVALTEAIDSLKWSKNARTRIIFLVLDAPPHENSNILSTLKDVIHKAAAKGIRIIPIAASGIDKSTEYLMRSIALGTNGTYTFLTNDSGIGNSHIQPTTDKYKVSSLNELLIRLIKTYSIVPRCEGKNNYNKIDLNLSNDSLISFKWKVWPNPTQDRIKIKVNASISELFVTDITGKILQRYENIRKRKPIIADLSRFPKGIYLVTFVYKEQKYIKKVIKI